MYSQNFEYLPARSIADAHRLLAQHPGAKLIAGGHSLIPLMKLRLAVPPAVVDIGRIDDLKGVSLAAGTLRIGALTTHAQISSSGDVKHAAPALAEAAAQVGDAAVRNRGTIGGNIAHADPASDLPTVLVALDADIIAAGAAGERRIKAAQFFTGVMTTALGEDEIVTAVEIAASADAAGSAYVKFSHPASRYAVVGAAASVTLDAGKLASVRAAIGGLVSHAMRAPSVERALIGQRIGQTTLAQAAAGVTADIGQDVSGDIFASAEYRRAMAPVYMKRALAAAVARAGA